MRQRLDRQRLGQVFTVQRRDHKHIPVRASQDRVRHVPIDRRGCGQQIAGRFQAYWWAFVSSLLLAASAISR